MSAVKTSKEKAAILLIALGRDYSAKVLKELNDEEIEQLTLEIANVRTVDSKTQNAVLKEFSEACLAQNYIMEGGIEYAKDILQEAIGQQRAIELISRLTSSLQVRPFDFVRRMDASQLLNMIQNEQPQTIALILSYLDAQQSADILAQLEVEIQTDVIAKIAHMGKTSPEHIHEVERILEKKMMTLGVSDYTRIGGIDTTVDILNAIDRRTEKHILDTLSLEDEELVDEIKSKMFLFEDIIRLNRMSIQRVLKEIEQDVLVLALKGVKEEVSEFIFANLSSRVQEMIREDLAIKGPVPIREVEEAQQQIVSIIRALEDNNEITITRGKEDQLIE